MFIINEKMLPSVPWRLKQEDPEFKAILSYIDSVFKKSYIDSVLKKKLLTGVMSHVQV